MMEHCSEKFRRQIRYSLIGEIYNATDWQNQAFDSLVSKCEDLINEQGYPSWRL